MGDKLLSNFQTWTSFWHCRRIYNGNIVNSHVLKFAPKLRSNLSPMLLCAMIIRICLQKTSCYKDFHYTSSPPKDLSLIPFSLFVHQQLNISSLLLIFCVFRDWFHTLLLITQTLNEDFPIKRIWIGALLFPLYHVSAIQSKRIYHT